MEKTLRKTGWQIFCSWVKSHMSPTHAAQQKIADQHEVRQQTPELRDGVYNPLKITRGRYVDIEDKLGRDMRMKCVEIDAYVRNIEGRDCPLTDYVLRQEEDWLTLRVIPKAVPLPHAPDRPDCILLTLQSTLGHEAGTESPYQELLRAAGKGVIEVREGDTIVARYNRIGGLKRPYEARVTIFDGDGQSVENAKYWDFSRETKDGVEFLILDKDPDSGIIKVYTGYEIQATDVTVF